MKPIGVFLFLAGWCAGQTTRMIRGELLTDRMTDLSRLTIRLEELHRQGISITSTVSFSGDFRLEGVFDGWYVLRVLDQRGNEIIAEPVTISDATYNLSIRLPAELRPRPRGGVSVHRVTYKPNPGALKAAVKAEKLAAEGRHDRAAVELERAVALDPKFAEAWNNLGVAYMRTRRYVDAIPVFEKAIAIDAACGLCQSNLRVALLRAGR